MKQDKRPGRGRKKRRFFNRISRKLMLFVVLMSMVAAGAGVAAERKAAGAHVQPARARGSEPCGGRLFRHH